MCVRQEPRAGRAARSRRYIQGPSFCRDRESQSKFPEGNLGGKWNTAAKERSMDSKKASRRKFLKGGAAAAAVGAIQSASAQAPAPAPVKRSLKDEVAYGERSHYVTSVRVAVLERA